MNSPRDLHVEYPSALLDILRALDLQHTLHLKPPRLPSMDMHETPVGIYCAKTSSGIRWESYVSGAHHNNRQP